MSHLPVPLQTDLPIRILIVDDYELVRQGIRLMIKHQPDMIVVGEADDRASALASAIREQPDIILLDLELGNDYSLEFLPDLQESCAANVIVFTGVVDSQLHQQALSLGAKGIVEKGQSFESFISAIKQVHAGETLHHDAESPKITSLTSLERTIISALSAGLKEPQVCDQVHLTESELHSSISSIQSKLGVTDTVELVVYAFRQGLAKPAA